MAAVDDCSSYVAWRGRSEEDSQDDLHAPVARAPGHISSVEGGMTAPASGETFGRFG